MRQQDAAQHLGMAGAEIERCFLQREVEALQPRQHQQHHEGGDEGDLARAPRVQGRAAALNWFFQDSSVEMPITAPGVRIGAIITPYRMPRASPASIRVDQDGRRPCRAARRPHHRQSATRRVVRMNQVHA